MLNEFEEFKAYTTFPDYTIKSKRDTGYLGRFTYKMIKECWDGIQVTMTTRICKKPSEWPVLYGIVLQNIILEALKIGAPADEVKRIALECSIALSRMGEDTFVTG